MRAHIITISSSFLSKLFEDLEIEHSSSLSHIPEVLKHAIFQNKAIYFSLNGASISMFEAIPMSSYLFKARVP